MGNISANNEFTSMPPQDGLFKWCGVTQTRVGWEVKTSITDIEFDASRSNPIYGNSDTVQPNSISCRFYIKF